MKWERAFREAPFSRSPILEKPLRGSEEEALENSKWQRISKETLLQNPYYRLSFDRYQLPNGAQGEYTYVDIPGSTMVLPVRDDGRLVLVRQFRYLLQRWSVELPAGGLKEGVDPLVNAQAELREEAGLEARSWSQIGQFAPYNGVSNEMCRVFLARDLVEVGAEPEPTEEIEVLRFELSELRDLIDRGELWDGMTIASLALYESHQRRSESQ